MVQLHGDALAPEIRSVPRRREASRTCSGSTRGPQRTFDSYQRHPGIALSRVERSSESRPFFFA